MKGNAMLVTMNDAQWADEVIAMSDIEFAAMSDADIDRFLDICADLTNWIRSA